MIHFVHVVWVTRITYYTISVSDEPNHKIVISGYKVYISLSEYAIYVPSFCQLLAYIFLTKFSSSVSFLYCISSKHFGDQHRKQDSRKQYRYSPQQECYEFEIYAAEHKHYLACNVSLQYLIMI